MTLAYFDCFAGAGGDMIVASLLDAGADLDALTAELAKLGVDGYELSTERVGRGGLTGTKFDVRVGAGDEPSRHYSDIRDLIAGANLVGRAGDFAIAALTRLAEAEAYIHNAAIEDVHFHEVGAIDSIVDVVGACVALELLGIDTVICSPIGTGQGTIQCDHGTLPVPAPATARMLALAEAPTVAIGVDGEATTPTGAALLTTLAESFGPLPPMTVSSVGYGAGTRTEGPRPNLLRVFVGAAASDGAADAVVELSANLDDCTGEILGATIERLMAAGCVDAWATPITTKKSRPGWQLSALCSPADVTAAEDILLTETTTLGVRRRICGRTKLARHHETIQTAFGPIRVKLGCRDERVLTASPEFEDCRAAAETHHVAIKDVMAAAATAYHDAFGR